MKISSQKEFVTASSRDKLKLTTQFLLFFYLSSHLISITAFDHVFSTMLSKSHNIPILNILYLCYESAFRHSPRLKIEMCYKF